MITVRLIVATLLLASPAAADPGSLLDGLLSDAPTLSVSLSNVAQNLGMVDGTFALETERHFAAIVAALEDWSTGRARYVAGLGSQVTEVEHDALGILAPLSVDVGQIALTAVGTIQSADLSAQFNAAGMAERLSAKVGTSTILVEAQAGVAGLVALQNVSLNSGRVDGEASLILRDVVLDAEGIATTAIGALQNGALMTSVDLDATVRGQVGAVSTATAQIVAALVGT